MSTTAPHPHATHPLRAQHRPGLGTAAAVVSASALAGAVGLAAGVLGLPARMVDRLPFHSPVAGGIALAVVVGAPYAVLAALAFRGDERTELWSLVAGLLLVGWIGVELLWVRELSFLQPTFALVGAAFAVVGWGAWPRLRRLVARGVNGPSF